MNATPLRTNLLAALAEVKLEAILIGNAAAAIQGAPVTTIDFDFMFRDTPTNLRKLKTVAKALHAVVMRPYYPVSKLYRMVNDDTGLQADFMPVIHGVRSFEGLKSRATRHVVGRQPLLVASLDDIIKSKKAAGGRSRAGVSADARREALASLAAENDRQLDDLIARRLALPVEKRMNFLRRRLPGGGSCL